MPLLGCYKKVSKRTPISRLQDQKMSDHSKFLYKYRAIDESNIDRVQRIFTDNKSRIAQMTL